ncbi:DUF4179 domain-containing protein [Clostridium sp. YIM B02505]|uniref:DUF4179 domain-containing protein n=1 Tax=Clostridium yunnanense TaxID=2800325 RepID=A0ABS1EU12_9CLOT|nr:DUF4179 domain-containing protein [Clostridium yunnanense]MBK1812830.1 DUF4179 domain-containing protein [Clostridium yunnanense]
MDNFLDNQIKIILNEDENIPEGVMNKINTSFEIIRQKEREAKAKKNRLRKRFSAVAAVLLLVVGISSYKPVFAAVKEFLFGYGDKGVQRAVDNNYMQKLSNIFSESSAIRIEATDIVVDSNKLAINLKLNFKDASVIKDKDNIMVTLALKDENGKSILKNMGGTENSDLSKKDSGETTVSIVLDSIEGNIPKSKNLHIEISTICLGKYNGTEKRINGSWQLNIPVETKFIDVKTIKYKPIDNNNKLEVISAEAFPTGMVVKFRAKNNGQEHIVNRAKLIGSNDKEYTISGSTSMENQPDGKVLVNTKFDATSFDDLDELKLKVESIDGKDEFVTLKKAK